MRRPLHCRGMPQFTWSRLSQSCIVSMHSPQSRLSQSSRVSMQSVSAQALPANCWAHLSVAAAGAQRRPSWGQVSLGLRGSALPALAASGLATSTTCGPCYNFNMWALSASLCKRVLAHYSQAPNLLRREMVQARPAAATAVPPPRPDSPSGDSPGLGPPPHGSHWWRAGTTGCSRRDGHGGRSRAPG
jgi:hypothetical protein